MGRRAKGDPKFDSQFRVPCYAKDLARWKRNGKKRGKPNLAAFVRGLLEVELGTPPRKLEALQPVRVEEILRRPDSVFEAPAEGVLDGDQDALARLRAAYMAPPRQTFEVTIDLKPEDPLSRLLIRAHEADEPFNLSAGWPDVLPDECGPNTVWRVMGRSQNYVDDSMKFRCRFELQGRNP